MANNLKQLRASAGWSADDAAKAMGLSASGYTKLERGERQLTENTIAKAAKAFGVPEASIIAARRAPSPYTLIEEPYWAERPGPTYLPPAPKDGRKIMPIYMTKSVQEFVFSIAREAVVERFERPHLLSDVFESYGFMVCEDSMSPAYRSGDYALVNPWQPVTQLTDAVFFSGIDEHGNGIATVARLMDADEKDWSILRHQTRDLYKLPKSDWPRVHKIVGRFNRRG